MKRMIRRYIEKECFISDKDNPILLSSGVISPYYFDIRKATMTPEILTLIVEEFIFTPPYSKIASYVDGFGGMLFGAAPIVLGLCSYTWTAGAIAHISTPYWNPLLVRKHTKDHGTEKIIEGNTNITKKIILIEDVVTTGTSALLAASLFRKEGIEIDTAFCVVDREEGGRELLKSDGIELYSLFKTSDFIGEDK